MRKIALVACSNGLEVRKKGSVEELCAYLEGLGFTLCVSPCLYEKDPVFCSVFSGTVEERAEALMSFYRDPEVQAILDLSGGVLKVKLQIEQALRSEEDLEKEAEQKHGQVRSKQAAYNTIQNRLSSTEFTRKNRDRKSVV